MRADDQASEALLADLTTRLAGHARAVETCLSGWLETGLRQPRLVAAMRHAVLAGGKRMRPYLVIESARRGEDIGSPVTLDAYQRWRRFDSTALALGMDTVNRLFSNDNPLLRAGRDIGLGIVNAMPGPRRRFIRQAAGLQGDLPRLLAGKAI